MGSMQCASTLGLGGILKGDIMFIQLKNYKDTGWTFKIWRIGIRYNKQKAYHSIEFSLLSKQFEII